MPRVSICIPTYCQIDYLRQTLQSVRSQDFNDYELIISDDSPDDTVAKLLESFNFGDRLRYYHNKIALGSPQNWNQAIRLANGDYIKILHHDDRLSHSNSLLQFVNILDRNPNCDFAFCASLVEDVVNGEKFTHAPTPEQLNSLSISPEELFYGNVIGAPSSTIYRNGLNIEYDLQMKWLVDIDFYIRILQLNNKFQFIDEALITTPTNALHQVTEQCKNSASIELREHLLLYKKHVDKLSAKVYTKYKWFELFEKYHIFTQENLIDAGIDGRFPKDLVAHYLEDYRKSWVFRFRRNIYKRLPRRLKGLINHIGKFNPF